MLLCAFLLAAAPLARAQSAPPAQDPAPAAASTAQSSIADDEGNLDPLEPDFSLINIPTTLRLPVHKGDFHLTHRFDQNLLCFEGEQHCLNHKLSTLLGIDTGANIGLEFRWAFMKHWQAVLHRTSLSQIIQLSVQYDAMHQDASHPISIDGIVAIEGSHNFGASTASDETTHYSPTVGLVLSRKIAKRLALYAEPFYVHNTAADGLPKRDTGFIGLGGRLLLSSSVTIAGEVSPRIGGLAIRNPQFGFALEKRVGGHVFSLTFTNDPGTTFRQISQGGNPHTLNLGFNLSRKFF